MHVVTQSHEQAAIRYRCPRRSFSAAAGGLTALPEGIFRWQFENEGKLIFQS